MATDVVRSDPRQVGKKPPFAKQEQDLPGSDAKLSPAADHGEQSYVGSQKLQGAATIVTGGDSGIGRAVAIAFAREGADVLISHLNESEDARESARWVDQSGRKAVDLAGDIQDETHCQAIVQRAVAEFGTLDVLVNNAAVQMPHQEIEAFSSEQFERVMRTNIFAMFYLCKAAMPHMRPGSVIINTASIQGYQPSAKLLDYATSKSAILGFTKALAKLAIEQGIRVNAVAPGPVWTPLIPASFPGEHVAHFGESSMLGRPAQPAELAPVYVLLASPAASYITGEVYGVTGGRTPL